MARPKKVEEKQLAPAVPQPVPIAAPQQPQQQPQQPNLVGSNLQGRVIDVDNFIKVRNSVSASTPTLLCRCTVPMPARLPPLLSRIFTTHLLCPFLTRFGTKPAWLPTRPPQPSSQAGRHGPSPPAWPAFDPQPRPVPFQRDFSQNSQNPTDKPSHRKCPSCTTLNPSPKCTCNSQCTLRNPSYFT